MNMKLNSSSVETLFRKLHPQSPEVRALLEKANGKPIHQKTLTFMPFQDGFFATVVDAKSKPHSRIYKIAPVEVPKPNKPKKKIQGEGVAFLNVEYFTQFYRPAIRLESPVSGHRATFYVDELDSWELGEFFQKSKHGYTPTPRVFDADFNIYCKSKNVSPTN